MRLLELNSNSTNVENIWAEFWNELHHQGDVDLASYAVVPQLVAICIKHQLSDWNVFALVAMNEACPVFGENPKLPQWLENDYHSAIKGLAEFGLKYFSKNWPKEWSQSRGCGFCKRIAKVRTFVNCSFGRCIARSFKKVFLVKIRLFIKLYCDWCHKAMRWVDFHHLPAAILPIRFPHGYFNF